MLRGERRRGPSARWPGGSAPGWRGWCGGPRTGRGESFVEFRQEAVGLLARRWWAITAAQLAGHLSVYGVLLVRCARPACRPAR